MRNPVKKVLAWVDQDTGEVEEVPRAPYAFDGPHINVGIRSARELASGDSGLTDKEFRVLFWYSVASEESEGRVEATQTDIAKELGMTPDALGRLTRVLRRKRLLLPAGSIGRTSFYRIHPALAFIGTGAAHRDAVKDWNPPETQVREPRPRGRAKKKGEVA